MTFSQFTTHFAANKSNVPSSLAAAVRRAAIARYTERMNDGYGAFALDFSDLIGRMETAVGGK